MLLTRNLLLSITLGLLFTPSLLAQGKSPKSGKGSTPTVEAQVSVRISDRDIATIRQYFTEHPEPRKPLPPGIAKNLARGKPLPPGIAKTRFPDRLSEQVPLPKGYEWVISGDVVVLVDPVGIVVDLLKEVF